MTLWIYFDETCDHGCFESVIVNGDFWDTMEFVCSDTAITFSIEKINTIIYELNAHVILGLLRLIKLTFSPYKT
jgi:hypothetical protein